jgi:hypothetical protein
MKFRIAVWATAGFLVASGWAVYFSLMTSKGHLIEPIVSALVRLTCPIAIIGSRYPIGVYSSVVANVATYALVGLVAEALRRGLISNARIKYKPTSRQSDLV